MTRFERETYLVDHRAQAFTREDDAQLERLVASEGLKWVKIAQSFPGRTAASVRNRWLRIERGKVAVSKGIYKNRCTLCGLPKKGHVCRANLQVRAPAHGSPAGTLGLRVLSPCGHG